MAAYDAATTEAALNAYAAAMDAAINDAAEAIDAARSAYRAADRAAATTKE